MSGEDIKILNDSWGIMDKMKLDFESGNEKFKELFDNIFDILEIYDFIQENGKPLKEEEDKSGN